jgi:hypothetical protein
LFGEDTRSVVQGLREPSQHFVSDVHCMIWLIQHVHNASHVRSVNSQEILGSSPIDIPKLFSSSSEDAVSLGAGQRVRQDAGIG